MNNHVKIGLWGGAGGQPCDMRHSPGRLVSVVVRSGAAIDAITFIYRDSSGNLQEEGRWGGPGGVEHKFDLGDTEYVKEISGTYGPWYNVPAIVTSLKFVTTNGQTHEYGRVSSGGSFHVPVANGQINGFFGRAGDLIDAIGVYVLP